jgi:hypothetical protein
MEDHRVMMLNVTGGHLSLENAGRDSIVPEIYRDSPYEFAVTSEATSRVFICGETVTMESGDPIRESAEALPPLRPE